MVKATMLIFRYGLAAQALHLPLPTPYLDKTANFTHGTSFAYAGATAVDGATLNKDNVAAFTPCYLKREVGWFLEFKKQRCEFMNNTSGMSVSFFGKRDAWHT